MSRINIPELFKDVAEKVAASLPWPVYYDYGRYLEITNRLLEKEKARMSKGQRYPLIWLVIPFKEHYGNSSGYCDIEDLQIIIATQTDPGSTTPDRMSTNFEQTLYPVYERLLKFIRNSGYFSEIPDEVPHTKIDQPYWDGKENGQANANLFSDSIDAIQLKNIRLTVNETTCDRFRIITGQGA